MDGGAGQFDRCLVAKLEGHSYELFAYPAKTPNYEKPNRLFCFWYRSRVRIRELRNLFEGEREAPSL
jgi:hypothetical protein